MGLVVGAAALYGLLTGLLALPGTVRLSTHLIGNNVDNWIFYWNNWWVETAIEEGHRWFFTPYAFFPQGSTLSTHSNSFLSSLLALPFKPLLGPIGAYNAVFLLGLWLSAMGMFLLVYDLTRVPAAALCAGFVFAFAPYHLTQALAHAHLGNVQWWPFYALCLRRALRRGDPRAAAGAGLFAALTLWTGLQLAVLLALWSAPYAAWQLREGGRVRRGASARALLITGGVAVLLSLPLLLPLVRSWDAVTAATAHFRPGMRDQTDMLAYALPPTYHPWFGEALSPIYARFVANRAYMPYLGYTALALAIVALARGRREAGFWGISAALWVLLAAGSALRFNGRIYPDLALPYRWLEEIFPISTLRAPDRFNLLVVFSLAVLTGLGAGRLATSRRRWLLLPTGLLLLVEYLCVPLPLWTPPPLSPFYAQMAAEAPDYGVVSYPMGYTHAKLWLYYQTIHEKPLVEAHISRYSTETYATILDSALLRALYQPTLEQLPPLLPPEPFNEQEVPLPALGPALRELREHDLRYLLVHVPYLDRDTEEQLAQVIPFPPRYADASLHVYDLRHPFALRYGALPRSLSPELTIARFDVQHDATGQQWQVGVILRPTTPAPAPRRCRVALEGERRALASGSLTFFRGESVWQAGDPDYQVLDLALPTTTPPGSYRWTLACEDAPTYRSPETLDILDDGSFTCLWKRVGATFDGTIRLEGYRRRTSGATLNVTLWWQALAPSPEDYKLFVHLVDEGGQLVAQYDAMPCAWACPTSGWTTGQRVADDVPLFLGGLPSGSYYLNVGFYDPATGERLPAFDARGERYQQDAVRLPESLEITVEK